MALVSQAPPPPALINADLICRAPDNVLLLLGLLRPEPEGCDDFYVRYGALQVLAGLMQACPDKLQVRGQHTVLLWMEQLMYQQGMMA